MTDTIKKYLDEVEARLKAASHGKSFINMTQSQGCEISLFDKEYTVFLLSKNGDFKQTEKDGELLINAPTDLEKLTKALRFVVNAIECYNFSKYYLITNPEILGKIEEILK